ncbi:hypothetical protein HMPREF2753_06335 [Neisseria sp. HMSC071C03]|nr:hypothetical protein HMPREF3054_04445 [Neisseria sp. HMSC071B12]OHR46396.1 hypothetical protein HMPREF2753_06335 [Neisseria sp. HMSC071C03]
MIEFNHVSKHYAGRAALDGVSLAIGCGEFFVLVGRSGRGKSTLLKMLNRLIEPDGGEILLKGENIAAPDLRALRLATG